jgi:preprotein translocase subunit SecD
LEKKIKIFKTIAIVFIILTISLISFVGVFRDKLNAKVNIIPDFLYGMELGGTREFKFTLDTTSEEKEVYVDEDGNYKGTVVDDSTSTSTSGISLDATTDEDGDVVAEEEADKVEYATETRTIKANDDSVLNQESYEESKRIIQARLEKAKISEYNIRLDDVTGNLILEVPENDDTDNAYQLALSQGKFEMIDGQTGVVLLDNNDIKKASAVYYTSSGYQAVLQIEFNKDKVETLKEISNTYVQITNEDDEEETKTVKLQLDGETLINTYFGEELSSGILSITMGDETTDYDTFAESYESASYFANIINNGKTPNVYTLASDNFVQSQITDDMIVVAKIAFAVVIAIVSVVMIIKYKMKGLLSAISSVGYIATTLLIIRYTNVTITLNSLIAVIGLVAVNYVFMFNYLKRMKTDSAKHAFTESIKEINITIIPLWVVSVIFTFMTNITISSVGMVMFWGLFVQIIYSFLFTRTLYVD